MAERKKIKTLARVVAVMVITLFAILSYDVNIAGHYNKEGQNEKKEAYATQQKNDVDIDSAHPKSVDNDPTSNSGTVKEEIPDQVSSQGSSQESSQEASSESSQESASATQNVNDPKKENNYKDAFSHSLFMGDSITEGLSFYHFVNKASVYSKLGLTLQKADKEIKQNGKNPPQDIFLMFGANDLEINGNDQFFLDNYRNLIQTLKAKWPDAHVYIQSILPIAPHAEKKYNYLNNERIERINRELETLAASDEKITYIKVRSVLVGVKKDLYEHDGIHLKKEFYTMWLDYLSEVLSHSGSSG